MKIIQKNASIVLMLALQSSLALAQTNQAIDANRFEVRGIRGGESPTKIKGVLEKSFQRIQCSDNSCEGFTQEKDANGGNSRREYIRAYFNDVGEAFSISYDSRYRVGNSGGECVPQVEKVQAQMLERYGHPHALTGIKRDNPESDNFAMVWGAEGLSKSMNPTVLGEVFRASVECSGDGLLTIKSEFKSRDIQNRRKAAGVTKEKPAF